MEFPEPANDYEASGSKIQRIAIGAGALIVVLLTVIVAIFLTLQDLPSGEDSGETPVVVIAPTETTATTVTPVPLPTFATIIPPTEASDTPVPTPTISPTAQSVEPTATIVEPTLIAPTDTPLPPPSLTPTTIPIDTPQPASDQPAGPTGECQPPAGWTAYVAQIGDTYASLAARTGTTVFELQRVNCPETATLNVGETIYLPGAPASVPSTSTPRPDPERTATPVPLTPEIDEIIPNKVDTSGDKNAIIVVLGQNFNLRRVELRAKSGVPVIALRLREQTPSEVSFEAVIPCTLAVGTYDMIVTNVSGRLAVEEDAVQVEVASLPDSKCDK